MVKLMTEAARGEPCAFDLEPLTETVLCSDLNVHRTLDEPVFTGNAQASLRAVLLTGGFDDLGVYKLYNVFILALGDIRLEYNNRSAQDSYLRGSKTDSVS